ncbi:MAG: YqhA family protein [Chloroflexi bacterium]|nr:YqhA family protein [Chloroflexota bacterium]
MKRLLESSKYLTLIGVFSLLIASIGAFIWGAYRTGDAMILVVTDNSDSSKITVALIQIIDEFLIATALLIFALAIYELFIEDLDLPAWLVIHDFHGLKTKLSSILILVMSITFLKKLIEWKHAEDTLFFGIAIALVSASLIAFGYFSKHD